MSSSDVRECKSPAQMKAFIKLTRNYRYMSDSRVFRETGCLTPCQKVLVRSRPKKSHAFSAIFSQTVFKADIVSPMRVHGAAESYFGRKGHILHLYIYFPSTDHFVRREYLLYTYDGLIADVGGYLGLLLGQRCQ